MNKEITWDDLADFQHDSLKYLDISKEVQQNGLQEVCFNREKNDSILYYFNVEITEERLPNQGQSYRCPIFAFYRVLKSILRKSSSPYQDVSFSSSYLDFFDKFEKINSFYNELIEDNNLTIQKLNNLANDYIGNYGTFHSCRSLALKYGLVPQSAMPDGIAHYDAKLMIELLRQKIKGDAFVFLNSSKEEKLALKRKVMKESYQFLLKIFGLPPQEFSYHNKLYTPLTFFQELSFSPLNDFVTVTSYSKDQFFNSYNYIPNRFLSQNEEIIICNFDKMQSAILKQIQDGVAVWFSAEESTTSNYSKGILDPNIEEYKKVLKIKEISKSQRQLLDYINYDHAMCITGALIEKGTVVQWKVDNSFGNVGTYHGHFIMTNDYLKDCVITVIVHKKYLS